MFNFGFDKRILYVILGLLVLSSLMRFDMTTIYGLLLTLPGVLIAITFHEFAHAYTAVKLGDDTPRIQGRVNLNPLSHIDPFGFIMLIFTRIGWGKPVQINPNNFNRNISLSKAQAIVSVAGPLMNFILAVVFTIIYFIVGLFAPQAFLLSAFGVAIMLIIEYTILVNIGLGVFNLLPIPPLDGSKIFRSVLPYKAKMWLDKYEQAFYIIFLVLWITGFAGDIISPVIKWISDGIFWLIASIFSLFL